MFFAAKLARLFLVAALLVAQQSALAHQIWHYAAAPTAHFAADPHESGSGGNSLCDQHAALGAVLGALGGADAAPEIFASRLDAVPAAALVAAPAAAVPPSSRGPPTLR